MLNIPGNIKLFTVQSGSMEPSISTGSLIIIKPMETYAKEDIINITEPADPKVSVTHRIIDIEETDDGIYYITKGDANESADTEKRSAQNVTGKVIFSIPLLGYLLAFAKTGAGLIVFIIIPALIVIVRELISIKEEAKDLIQKKKLKRRGTERSSIMKVLLLVGLVSMSTITSTAASLSDTEVSKGNTMVAGVWTVQEEALLPLSMSLLLPEDNIPAAFDGLTIPVEKGQAEEIIEEATLLLSSTSLLPDEIVLEEPLEVASEAKLGLLLQSVNEQPELGIEPVPPDPTETPYLISEAEIIEE